MRTSAPSFNSLSRMLPQVESAKWVCASPMRRSAQSGHRGEPEAKLIGSHGGGRGAISEQVEQAFLDAALHLTARAQ